MAGHVRGFETVGDMLRSLSVVGVFVLVILLITLRETPEKIKPVDPAPVAAGVAQAAPFAAEVPGPTPPGWTPTSARVTPPTARPYSWYVGYSTDTEQFVAVAQVYGEPDAFLREVDAEGDPYGTVVIGGDEWQKRQEADGSRRALVRTKGDVTTVVVGTAPIAVLQTTAGALRPTKSAATPAPTAS